MKIERLFKAKLTLVSDSKLCDGCFYINYIEYQTNNSRYPRFAYIDKDSFIDVARLKRYIRDNVAVDLLIERKQCPYKDGKQIDYLIQIGASPLKNVK